MKLRLTAPDTMRPRGLEPIPIPAQQGVWAILGALLLFLSERLDIIPWSDALKPYVPLIGMVLGFVANALLGPDQYRPVPPSL